MFAYWWVGYLRPHCLTPNHMNMKTQSLLLFLVASSFAFFGYTSKPLNTVTITLNVDTREISEENLERTCRFEGQEPEMSTRDFMTLVGVRDIVVWDAVSISDPENDKVEVTLIERNDGADLFGKERLRDDAQNRGVVVGSVLQGRPGEVQKYTMKIKVYNGAEVRGTYEIDPKLKVKG